jgi:outer membrane lipoprotein SlyB
MVRTTNGTTDRTAEESFRHYDADEISTVLGVSGWVPAQNVTPLLNEVPSAKVQYRTDNGSEAFVVTK